MICIKFAFDNLLVSPTTTTILEERGLINPDSIFLPFQSIEQIKTADMGII